MRVILSIVGVLAFLAAIAVILLHMTGNAARDSDTFWSVIGCLLIGAVSLGWAVDLSRPAGSRKKSIEIGK